MTINSKTRAAAVAAAEPAERSAGVGDEPAAFGAVARPAPVIGPNAARRLAESEVGSQAKGLPRFDASTFVRDVFAYAQDAGERSVLFWDALRQRADNMLAHERAGKPPLLDFDYEILVDARRFERPANYALLRVTRVGDHCLEDCLDETKPPVVILDPRAGHGPGIGGFKRDSEVGVALHQGYPVYFVMFYPEPVAEQTLADVLHVLRRFVEEVARRHPGRASVLYGNCQAGWADIRFARPGESFEHVRELSERNETFSQAFVSPWVQAFATPWSAAALEWLHPMRTSRYLLSEAFMPWMRGTRALTDLVGSNRYPAASDNPFRARKIAFLTGMAGAIQAGRRLRDAISERGFEQIYGAGPAAPGTVEPHPQDETAQPKT